MELTRKEVREFVRGLDKAIAFHKNNQHDPHGIGESVRCALIEVRGAFMKALQIPYSKNQPDIPSL